MAEWINKFGSNNRLPPLLIGLPPMSILRACPYMTLAVEWCKKTPAFTTLIWDLLCGLL